MTNEFQHSFQVPICNAEGAVNNIEISMQIRIPPQLQGTASPGAPSIATANGATQTSQPAQQKQQQQQQLLHSEVNDKPQEHHVQPVQEQKGLQAPAAGIQPEQKGIFQVIDRSKQAMQPEPAVQPQNQGAPTLATAETVDDTRPVNNAEPSHAHCENTIQTNGTEKQEVPTPHSSEALKERVPTEEQAPEPVIAEEKVKEEPANKVATEEPSTAAPGPEIGSSAAADQPKPAEQPSDESSSENEKDEVTVMLSEKQADPNNPLHSVKDFSDLNLKPELLKGLTSLNFRKPSAIQEMALPLLLRPQAGNMIGQSQSGTGKTAAFILNILSRVNLEGEMAEKPQALVVVPTRELARQIANFVEKMGQWLPGLKVNLSVPDNGDRDARMQPIKASVIVGTPATIFNQMTKRVLARDHVRVIVLDEADVMLENSLRDQCCRIKANLKAETLQVILFSATWSEEVERFAEDFAPEANRLALPKKSDVVVRDIKQVSIACDAKQRYDCLLKFYGLLATGSSVIFVRTREDAAEIARRMEKQGYVVGHLTGKNDTTTRDQVIDKFRNGQIKVLIATNVLARGIDVDTISLVVNFDLPDKPVTGADGKTVSQVDPETYIHRIGRTGRFGRLGVAVSFITSQAEEQFMKEVEKRYECEVEHISPNTEDEWEDLYDNLTKILKDAKRSSKM